jgi:hypothetical protein
MRVRVFAPLLVALATVSPAVVSAADGAGSVGQQASPGLLGGRVLADDSPLAAASVYLYHLADAALVKATTDEHGGYRFDALPAGLYKVVAFKAGFLPAVVMLTRAAADLRQSVDLELEGEAFSGEAARDDFWAVRGEIPSDVLRDIEVALFANPAIDAGERRGALLAAAKVAASAGHLRTRMEAVAGVDALADYGAAQVTGGRLGLQGAVGGYEIGLTGDYRQLAAVDAASQPLAVGESRAMTFRLESPESTSVGVRTLTNTLTADGATGNSADFEHYQVNWSQRIGRNGQSDFAAQYTAENNFYRQSWMDLVGVPAASRTWVVEGSYTARLDDRSTIQTGLRYRLREDDLAARSMSLFLAGAGLPQENLDLYALGGTRVQPAFLVEYGLYTTLADGSTSLVPRGGFVVQLGGDWQVGSTIGHRLRVDGGDSRRDFIPAFYDQASTCELGENACYRVFLARQPEEGSARLSFGVTHREFADTLRLYFNEDVFNHLESLFLVRGDALSEAQVSWTHELTPRILATLSSSVAVGGGGELTGRDKLPYSNAVRYLVTSLDTRFERTSTGVFVAFQHLEQHLDPISGRGRATDVAVERLQLLLSQDLNVLLDLSADWALRVNMELSRGETLASATSDGALRRQVTGGVAVSF